MSFFEKWVPASFIRQLPIKDVESCFSKNIVTHAMFGVAAVLCAMFFYLQHPVLVDDNYITYRVATNWAEGLGPVFSPGDTFMPVTSPLWTGLIAAVIFLFEPSNMVTWTRAIGAFFLLIGSIPLYLLLKRNYGHIAILSAPVLFFTAELSEGVGNEIPLMLALSIWVAWAHLEQRSLFLISAILACLYLTRAEGVLIGILVAIGFLYSKRSRGILDGILEAKYAIGLFLFIVGMWHFYYLEQFHAIFPKSLAVKRAQGASSYWPEFHQYLLPYFLKAAGGSVLLSVFSLVGFVVLAVKFTLIAAWILLHVFAYSLLGVPNYDWYYYPFFLGIALGFTLTVFEVHSSLRENVLRRVDKLIVQMIGAALLITLVSVLFRFPQPSNVGRLFLTLQPNNEGGDERFRNYTQVGNWLRDTESDPKHSLVMAFEIGIIGYTAREFPFIDPPGILWPTVTKDTVNKWGLLVRLYKPKYLVFRELDQESLIIDNEGELTGAEYRRVARIPGGHYHQTIYQRVNPT